MNISKYQKINWRGLSGPTTPETFKKLVQELKKHLRKMFQDGEVIGFKANHFETSGFIRKDDKYVYIRLSDVRNYPNFEFLVRIAKHSQDYIGGQNHTVNFEDLYKVITKLLEK